MTGYQVIQAIKLALDKYSASTSAVIGPAFLDEEICAFANQAMIETICTKFTGHNQLQQGFEQSVKRISDLEQLIVQSEHKLRHNVSNQYKTAPGTFDDLNRMFLVSVILGATTHKNEKHLYVADHVDRQTAEKFLKTPTNYPWIPVPKVTTFQVEDSAGNLSKGLAVYIDSDWTTRYNEFSVITEYVVQPNGIDVDKDTLEGEAFDGVFPDAVLNEIINRAALLMLDNIESQRTQVKSELNSLQE